MTATTSAPSTTSAPATRTTSGGSGGGSADQFSVSLSGVANVVKSVEGLVGSGSGTAGQVASVVLDVLSFAGIGAPVGAQNTALNAKHVESLHKVLELITKIKGLVEQAAQGYADADQATAKGFGGDTGGSSTGSSTTTEQQAAQQPTDQSGDQPTTDTTTTDTAAQTGGDTSGPHHNGLPEYVSPNPHPAVVGQDRQGHHLYDMTGHTAPTTRPAGNLDGWIADAKTALAANGVDTSSMSDSDLRALIQHESSGNPNALNNWDSNARNGIPSKGLMQTIDPTFNNFALPGHTDIWNPTDNIIAGVRYGIDRYGSFDQIPGVRALHHGRGYVGY